MKKTALRKYANLIAKVGANVQKGQEVIVRANLENPDFVTMVVEECYKLGAKEVTVDWRHTPISKLHYAKRSLETLSEIKDWEIERLKYREKVLPVLISLAGDDPDGMKGIDQEKVSKSSIAVMKVTKPYSDRMSDLSDKLP